MKSIEETSSGRKGIQKKLLILRIIISKKRQQRGVLLLCNPPHLSHKFPPTQTLQTRKPLHHHRLPHFHHRLVAIPEAALPEPLRRRSKKIVQLEPPRPVFQEHQLPSLPQLLVSLLRRHAFEVVIRLLGGVLGDGDVVLELLVFLVVYDEEEENEHHYDHVHHYYDRYYT